MNESGPKRNNESEESAKKQRVLLIGETKYLLKCLHDSEDDIKIRRDFIKALKASDTFEQANLQKKFGEEHDGYQMEMGVQRLEQEISSFNRDIAYRDLALLEKLRKIKYEGLKLSFWDNLLNEKKVDKEIKKVKARLAVHLAVLKGRIKQNSGSLKEDTDFLDSGPRGFINAADTKWDKEIGDLKTEIARVESILKE